jgi:hypothetical protein
MADVVQQVNLTCTSKTWLKTVGYCWRILCRNGFTVFTMFPTWNAKSWIFGKPSKHTIYIVLCFVILHTSSPMNRGIIVFKNVIFFWIMTHNSFSDLFYNNTQSTSLSTTTTLLVTLAVIHCFLLNDFIRFSYIFQYHFLIFVHLASMYTCETL